MNPHVWNNRLQKFIDNPKAVIPFLRKRLYYNFVADRELVHYKDFRYLNYTDTLSTAITEHKSLVRFGDELFDMIEGIGLYFGGWRQRYHPMLAGRLKQVISSDDPHLLICFNPEFILMTKAQFQVAGISEQYQFWTNSKMFLKDYFKPNVLYGSALCFHPRYNTAIDYRALHTFFSSHHVIIVTSNTKRFKDISLGITTQFVEAPQSDAWDAYDFIYKEVQESITRISVPSEKVLVLVSMGSAAKILVYDLMKTGYTAWDTGQFFDLAATEIRNLAV
jgi:hypothetical protein